MFEIPAADYAGARFEGAIFSGSSLYDAKAIGHSFESPRSCTIGEIANTFEWFHPESMFTDDSILSCAMMQWLTVGGNIADILRDFVCRYKDSGFGKYVLEWALADDAPPKSVGNGAAMRIVPLGYAFETVDELLATVDVTSRITHMAEHAIDGAKAVALAVYFTRKGVSASDLMLDLNHRFGYCFRECTDALRKKRTKFSSDCQDTVPQAIRAALESDSYEQAVRRAISLGGDTDTMGVIAGGVAAAKFGIPSSIVRETEERLPDELRKIIGDFNEKFFIKR